MRVRLYTKIAFQHLATICSFSTMVFYGLGQEKSPVQIITKKEKGIEVVQKDSLFSLRFQFRMQNRAGYQSVSTTDLTPESFEFRVRRLRLAMRGFVYNPKFTYYIQLSFSRGDMDWSSTSTSVYNTSPNVVRDAMVFYEPVKDLKFGFGQTKLPGNRQRVISSGNLQFADRSIVNSTFTLDRDYGLFSTLDKKYFRIKGAISSGEGRNSLSSDRGLSYTGRVEILPFGKFTGDNEDQEGDLVRELKPKLSIAGGYNYNSRAVRQGGTLGSDLYSLVNIQNVQVDYLFKYRGFAILQEFCNRIADIPITTNLDSTKFRTIYVGQGINTQLSYNFKNNIELAVRYAFTSPNKSIYDNTLFPSVNEKQYEQYILGATKYLYGHRLKVQGNLVYNIRKDLKTNDQTKNVGAVFQIELGI